MSDAQAQIDVLGAASDRATPACPHFGVCGGCQLQDVAYAAQLAQKADRLRALLEPTGFGLPQIRMHASPAYAYRNRIRLTLRQVAGRLRAGYIGTPEEDEASVRAKPAATFVPIEQCPIAAPILWRATEAFLALANEGGTEWIAAADQLELFTNSEESRLQFTLSLRTQSKKRALIAPGGFSKFCDALRGQLAELTGAGVSLLPVASSERSRRVEQATPGPVWGKPGLMYAIADTEYWVPRGAFFQANRFLLPELVKLVTAGGAGTLAWDLYAGVGLFSRVLAASFAQVAAVEAAEPAATTLAATKLPNLGSVKAKTLDFLKTAVLQRERPGLIVLDPPRTGAGAEVCGLLARVAAKELVYVSCSPQALAADLVALAASGYSVAELHLFDLFPQTTHIETVALLQR
jgi:23S rRNA (uracil1939-C5)-methyltransferase